MKKALFLGLLLPMAFGLFSCATSQGGNSGSDGVLTEVEKVLSGIYDDHRSSLILDNASNYTVKKGDTLVTIAKKQYGDSNPYFFPLIMVASSDVVIDPNLVKPGDKLTVPDLQRNLSDAGAKQHLKTLLEDFSKSWKGPHVTNADREGMSKTAAGL